MSKNIIFDWSGVIKDAVDSHFWTVKKMFEKMGVMDVSIEEMKENWEEPYMLFYNKYIPRWTIEEQRKVYLEVINQKDYPKSHVYEGMVEFIKKLKKEGKFLAVLSSDPPETILPEMKKFGLENIFDDMIMLAHGKADGINKIMEDNNLKKDEVVFIGDSNHEVEVGKELGIKTIAVNWGLCTEEKLKSTNPDYLVHNVKELEEILLK